MGRLYVAVLHEILLFRLETWVLIPRMSRTLGGFHHQVVQQIMGNTLKRRPDGRWEYPLIVEALREVKIEEL